jgi:hypothetical protein
MAESLDKSDEVRNARRISESRKRFDVSRSAATALGALRDDEAITNI